MDFTKDNRELDARRQRDRDDLQDEIAGRETGRARRFLPEDERSAEGARKKRERAALTSRLMQLLQDPIYRELYDRTMMALSAADQRIDAALSAVDAALDEADAALREIEANAARLADGTRVYRDAEGIVRRADGSVVDPDLAATIVWRGDEPSYEEMLAAKTRRDDLRDRRDELLAYLNGVLGPARDRLTDPDDPPDLDELRDILDDIETGMPDLDRSKAPDPRQAEDATQDLGAITLPDLGARS